MTDPDTTTDTTRPVFDLGFDIGYQTADLIYLEQGRVKQDLSVELAASALDVLPTAQTPVANGYRHGFAVRVHEIMCGRA